MPATKRPARPAIDLPRRQVHLDFHTSPLIPGIGADFDAREFAATMRRARVDSVTVFAKCHHGMCYYPTRVGVRHPGLERADLLGEMIEALHREGIRAPIYTTVAWEEDVAHRHPEWGQLRADGTRARVVREGDSRGGAGGGWWFNDWTHPDYLDLIEAHVAELLRDYPVDGIFFDILFHAAGAHHGPASRAFRARHGLEADDDATFRRFVARAQDVFCARFSARLRAAHPGATVFYNSGFEITIDPTVSARVRTRHATHVEVESLPSGFWGYHHFPRVARAVSHWGEAWLGMTGRFQKNWGDFGGLKPEAALEYECFRSQALGGGNSIGDQLPPRGRLEGAAYERIGRVYARCAEAEPWYAGSRALPAVGVLTAAHPSIPRDAATLADEGIVQMCEEKHYDAVVLDELTPWDGLRAILLPDHTVLTPRLARRLERFHAAGGALVLSYRAGRDAEGRWMLPFLPLRFGGEVGRWPNYWRARPDFVDVLGAGERVCYGRGLEVKPGRGARTWVGRALPYFQRTDGAYCSHAQTPPEPEESPWSAVVAGRGFVYFADPVFAEYRLEGNTPQRDAFAGALERLIGPAPFGAGLPTTVLVVPRRRDRDLLLTLLHYVPVRKALAIDVCEERMGFGGLALHLPAAAREVRIEDTGETLARGADGTFPLPLAFGRLRLTAAGFFAGAR